MTPPEHCLEDPSFAGRLWQLVSEERQAANLVGAYEYANTHWPWMGPMFVFNLNLNLADWYAECDQIRYYAVEDRPAENALRDGLIEELVPAILSVSPLVCTVTVSGEGLISTAGPDQGSLLPLAEVSFFLSPS